jgi:hypothetical protein
VPLYAFHWAAILVIRKGCGIPEGFADAQWGQDRNSQGAVLGGAVTGKVMDSDLVAKLSFIGRAAHPEFEWQKTIPHDMKAGPWTTFAAGEMPLN